MKPSVIAILDVGKTNKKTRIYDRNFQVLAEERTSIEPTFVDGLEIENTNALFGWFKNALKKLSSNFEIQTIAITTHGATCAILDEQKNLAHPVLSYTATKGLEIVDEFFATFGDPIKLHRETCSPDLGFANVGKHLFYIRARKPEVWKRTKYILLYPSYLGFELTGAMGLEPTYLGNHTYLWNFAEWRWSSVAIALEADKKLPTQLSSPWDLLGYIKPSIADECGLSPNCKVTQGIHDSNANYLPYLAQGHRNFLLNSTGTWCVLMTPSDHPHLTDEEIQDKVFYNLDALGKPVRTCIFPAGMEYDTFRSFTEHPDKNDKDAMRNVIAKKQTFVIPGVLPGAKPFPNATPRVVHNGTVFPLESLKNRTDKPMTALDQEYYGALNLSLALATRKKLNLCGVKPGTKIFIEGGFANNVPYCVALASLCPELEILLTNVKEGTSLGTAITAWMLAEQISLKDIGKEFHIETQRIQPEDLRNIHDYESIFNQLITE